MEFLKLKLAAVWIALMFTYLLGDVLRIYSGDSERVADDMRIGSGGWLGAAVIMTIPIVMIVLSLFLNGQVNRRTNIAVAAALLALNASSIHTYPGIYDRYLLAVSLAFNALTIRQAWKWT